jgi:hypothetical protein
MSWPKIFGHFFKLNKEFGRFIGYRSLELSDVKQIPKAQAERLANI